MLKISSDGCAVGEGREAEWRKADCVEQETSQGRESQKPVICCLIGSLMVCVINGVTTSSPPPPHPPRAILASSVPTQVPPPLLPQSTS